MASERRFAMGSAVGLRDDYDSEVLRRLARAASDAGQVRRLVALAVIYAGGTRGEAAAIGGVGLQTVRDWVLRFNSEGPSGLETGKAPGKVAILGDRERTALRRIVEEGPNPGVHGGVGWRIAARMQGLWEEYRLSVSKQTMRRSFGPWVCASCRRGRATMPRIRAPKRLLKKFRRECGADR